MQSIANSIDVDIGGTFTDCYIRLRDKLAFTKAPTTGYDLSVGFIQAIEEGAEELGLSLEELLETTEVIRYSTTMAMNRLIERKGPTLALITTRGFEDVIFIGKGSQWQDGLVVRDKKKIPLVKKPDPLIPRDLVIGVRERVDSFGRIIMSLDETDFREQLHSLVDRGVRGFVVCLLWAQANPAHERRVKEIIEEEYPDYYLGAMPVVLSHEVLPKKGEYSRSMTAILSAYLHQSMSEELSSIHDHLRDRGHKRPLKMVHNTGGMADMFSTTAIQTYNGGPVAGLIGSAHIANQYGVRNVIVTDMGGTSFDLGLVVEGSTRFYQFMPVVDRWLVGITLLETQSIGAGGGSIAWKNDMFNRLEVGPMSAGSIPGPACYDLGGEDPTVTDADLVLGYLNPYFYHGGRIELNRERAIDAIKRRIAKPFGVEIEQAALMIKKIVDGNMGNAVFKETALRGFDPSEFMLFAFGGAGPTHCCGYADYIMAEKVYIFPYSPVFCAFGSSVMDISRIYEQSKHVVLTEPRSERIEVEPESFNSVVRQLQQRALKDLRPEGYSDSDVVFQLQLDMKFGSQIHVLRANSPRLFIQGEADVKAICAEFIREYGEVFSPLAVYPQGGIDIENFALKATVVQYKPDFPKHSSKGSSPKAAYKGKRPIYWEEYGSYKHTAVYDHKLLECGNVVDGPTVIEEADTTIVIPPGKRFVIDQYLNGVIESI